MSIDPTPGSDIDDAVTMVGATAPAPAEPLAYESETVADDALTERYTWRRTWLNAGVLLFCGGLAAAALGFGVWAWRLQGHPHPGPPAAASSSTPATSAASPAVPPTEAPSPMPVKDRLFKQLLDKDQLHFSPEAIGAAGAICRQIESGQTPGHVAVQMAQNTDWSQQQADWFVADAMTAYCPHAGMPS